MVLGGLALVVILGLARVAGADAGGAREGSGGTAGAGMAWEVAGEGGMGQSGGPDGTDGSAPTAEPDETEIPATADGPNATGPPAPTAEPEPGPSSRSAPTAGHENPGVLGAGSPDWWEVLGELDRRRARALTALDPELIVDYAWPDSAVWSADAALVASLRGRGLRPRGLSSRVLAVERAEAQGGRARVQIVDQRAAYTLVDAQGAVVETVPAARLTRWSVTLAEDSTDPPGWRVLDVTAVDGRPAGEGEP